MSLVVRIPILLITFIGLIDISTAAKPSYKIFDKLSRFEDFSALVSYINSAERQARSIEGAPCGSSSVSTDPRRQDCSFYPYTTCSALGQCVCNLTQAVRVELLPGYAFCLPIQYARDTRRCLPTEPDICTLAFAGSRCVYNRADGTTTAPAIPHTLRVAVAAAPALAPPPLQLVGSDQFRPVFRQPQGSGLSYRQSAFPAPVGGGSGAGGEWRCQCAIDGGTLDNCKLFVGMSCTNNASLCTNIGRENGQPSTVECNSTADGDAFAKCGCTLGTEPSRDKFRCIARQCPLAGTINAPSPCRGNSYECYNPSQSGYLQGSGRYFCGCKDVGVNHSEFTDGLCCALGSMPCADFSACIQQSALCDGNKDCADCSDEELRICARPLPKDAQCVRQMQPRTSLDDVVEARTASGSTPLSTANYPNEFGALVVPLTSRFSNPNNVNNKQPQVSVLESPSDAVARAVLRLREAQNGNLLKHNDNADSVKQ